MNKIIDLFAKFSGASAVWSKLDGYKTRIAAVAAILSGLAGLLGDISGLMDKHSLGAVLDFCKTLPTDANWLMLVGGFGLLGVGHKLEKASPGAAPSEPVVPLAKP